MAKSTTHILCTFEKNRMRRACTFASLSASTSTCTAACVARSSPQRCSKAAAAASASCVAWPCRF